MGLKKRQLLLCFNTLSDHSLLEAFGHANNGLDDDSFIWAGIDFMQERLVELQCVDGKSRQIA